MPVAARNSEHLAEECEGFDCPRFPWRMYHAGCEVGYRRSYVDGYNDGCSAGFAAGYSAGGSAAVASATGGGG
jgi:hypothetical protein